MDNGGCAFGATVSLVNGFVHRTSVHFGDSRRIRDEPVVNVPRNTGKSHDHDASKVKGKKQYVRANCIPNQRKPRVWYV